MADSTTPSPPVSSTSSFILLSSQSDDSTTSSASTMTSSSYDSDDEIVWNVSESSLSPSSVSSESALASDDDFILLSGPRPRQLHTGLSTPSGHDDRARTPNIAHAVADLEHLTLSDGSSDVGSQSDNRPSAVESESISANTRSKTKQKKKDAKSRPSPAQPNRPSSEAKVKALVKTKKKNKKKAISKKNTNNKKKPAELGARPIVDDISERSSDNGDTPSMYEEAVGFITSFLSNPEAREDSVCRLTLLQSLIIELGFAYSSLPASLTAAKAFLKSRAFLNVKEYLAVRGQGPAAVQRILYPSRTALIKDIRKKRNSAPLRWVKENGLQVLLVPCYR